MRVVPMLCVLMLLATGLQAQMGGETPKAEPTEPAKAGALKWETDYKAAAKKAEEAKKPLLLDMYTEWCYWCKVMDEKVWSDEAVAKLVMANYIPCKVDCEADTDTAEKYGAEAFPTIVIADADGTIKLKFEGAFATSAKPGLEWLEKVGKALADLPKVENEFLESKHTSLEAGEKLVKLYGDLSNHDKIVWVYEELLSARGEGDAKSLEIRLKAANAALDAGDIDKAQTHEKVMAEAIKKEHALYFDFRVFQAMYNFHQQETETAIKIADELREELLKRKDERIFDMTDWYLGAMLNAAEDEKAEIPANKKGRELYLAVSKAFEGDRKIEARVKAAYYAYASGDKEVGMKEMKELAEMKGELEWLNSAREIVKHWENPDEEGEGDEDDMDG